MPIAISHNGIEYEELRERLQISHRIGRTRRYFIAHPLGIANAARFVFALRQESQHLAEVLLMHPQHTMKVSAGAVFALR